MARFRIALLFGWVALIASLALLDLECRRPPRRAQVGAPATPLAAALVAMPAPFPDEQEVAAPHARRRRGRSVGASDAPSVVSGMVVDHAGLPVGGAAVSLDLSDDSPDEPAEKVSGRADEQGHFELEAGPGEWALTAQNDDDVSEVASPLSLGPGERLDGLILVLGGGGAVSGRLEVPSGVTSAELCVMVHRGDAECIANAAIDDDFTFDLAQLPRRPLWLRGRAEGAEAWLQVTPPAANLALRIGEAAVVSGLVRGDDGAPVEGARVSALGDDGVELVDASTDAAGRFEAALPMAAPKVVSVWARTGDAVSPSLRVSSSNARGLVLLLGAGSDLVGRVVQAASGAPMARAAVTLHRGDNLIDWERCDEEGRYHFSHAPAGPLTVAYVVGRGRAIAPPTVAVVVGAANVAVRAPDLRVDVPRTIRGRVTDEEGRPVQNAEVDLVKGDGDFAVLNHRATDAQGLFSLDQPLLGPAVLRAAFEGTVGAQVRVGASPGLAEEWVELRVAKASQVGGVVRGDDGRPRAAVRVRCGDTERTTSTGGRFELACPRGSALTFDDGHAARTVAVGAGESLYLEIPL